MWSMSLVSENMGNPKKRRAEMNVAIVIAGGVGSRMGQEIPKQFINV